MGRTLGLDLGSKRTGGAISDALGITAQPLGVHHRTGYKSELKWIRNLLVEYKFDKIVVGHPVNMDGSSGERAELSENFARKIKRDMGIEVILWDERLTTAGAERMLIGADVSRAKRKKVVDQVAAQLILSSWLDFQANKAKQV